MRPEKDWDRIRRERIALVTRSAEEFISRAKSMRINLEPSHVDRNHLAAAIDGIVNEYIETLRLYKERNGYSPGGRVQPTKIAAFLAFIVATRCPIRTGDAQVNSVEAALANAYLAWRLIQTLLHIDSRKIGDENVEYIVRSLHNIDSNCGSRPRFREDWAVVLMEAMVDAWGERHWFGGDLA